MFSEFTNCTKRAAVNPNKKNRHVSRLSWTDIPPDCCINITRIGTDKTYGPIKRKLLN